MDLSVLKHLSFSYSVQQLQELESIENILHFTRFTSQDAFDLGALVLENAKKYEKGIAIVITREKDQLPLFQHVMDGASQKNLDFAALKRNCVLETGHCSFWKLVQSIVNEQPLDAIFNSESSIPVGGAFPIYIEDELVGTLAVSGLHNGLDQELIVQSLSNYLNKEIVPFTGKNF